MALVLVLGQIGDGQPIPLGLMDIVEGQDPVPMFVQLLRATADEMDLQHRVDVQAHDVDALNAMLERAVVDDPGEWA
jgi:hypothetical protein